MNGWLKKCLIKRTDTFGDERDSQNIKNYVVFGMQYIKSTQSPKGTYPIMKNGINSLQVDSLNNIL